MSRLTRLGLVLCMTVVALGIALSYPWVARGEAWLEANFQRPYLLFGLALVPVAWWMGTFGQDARTPRLKIGTVAPFLRGPRGFRTHFRDMPGVLRAVALTLLVAAMARPVSVLKG